jgi:hypothetical protein
MQPSQRQLSIVSLTALFGFVSSKQLQALLYSELKSNTPYKRDIDELVAGHYLDRVERQRLIGGANAGSGQYAYRLGTKGRELVPDARKTPDRTEVHHSLLIVECYRILVELEREGKLTILGFLTEPESALKIDRYTLEPDLLVDLARPNGANSIRILFEAERTRKTPRRIRQKLADYWQAYQAADERQWPSQQIILWVTETDRQAQSLKWLIEQGKPDEQKLFRVLTIDNLATALSG